MANDLPKKTHPYDNPDSIISLIKTFKELDWKGKHFKDVLMKYRTMFEIIPTYPIKVQKGTILFRGRVNSSTDLIKELKDVGIKPKELVTSFGRANIPNNPVFYCSSNEETVVGEVTQWYINENGRFQDLITKNVINENWHPSTSMLTISAWLVKEDLNIALLFNGQIDKRSISIQQHGKDRYDTLLNANKNHLHSKNLLIDFFSNEFGKTEVKHEFDYIYSAYYAFEVFANEITDIKAIKFDGIKYTSIANENRGENYAISEYAFKNKVEFLGANYCYAYNNQDKGIIKAGKSIIEKVKSAILKDNQTFEWIEANDDCNYIVKNGNNYNNLNFKDSIKSRQ